MKKYFLKVFGCQMNESDSQRIASFLENQGYESIKGADLSDEALAKADLIVVVACSVRQSAIDRIFGLKKSFKKINAKKILTGCVLKSDKKKFQEFFNEVLSIDEFLGKNYLELRPKLSNPKSVFVPIMTGCNNFCSYCAVPYTRGRETSRPAENIIKEIKGLINPAKRGKQKYKEIIVLGQNVNSYKDGKNNFPKLLKMISEIPGDFIIRFLTSHPKDFSDELINVIANSSKISKEIHLPVQSGNDEILRKMNRGYTAEKYLSLIEKIRNKIPDAKITTDIIVGFPGETAKQFNDTVKIFKKAGFFSAYINKYSTRQGTTASRLKDDIPLEEKKKRWKILNDLINNPPCQKKLIAIVGPTASGKSAFAVKLAEKINGEIISADSRQVYKKMNIGTGKISKKQMKEIPHYIIDIVNPKKQFTITEFKKKALEAIDKIYKKEKIPIICGGTGFYVQAIVENLDIPKIEPDWKLRKKLENKTTEELFDELKKIDPNRAKNIDSKNRRRLIRALEIIKKTGKPVPVLGKQPKFEVFYIGIRKSLPKMRKSINKRIDKMIKAGLEKEVYDLIKNYGKTVVLKNTIGYKEWLKNLPVKMRKAHLSGTAEQIKLHTYQFAKRQLTWLKKYPGNKKIHWVKNSTQAEKLVKKFLPR